MKIRIFISLGLLFSAISAGAVSIDSLALEIARNAPQVVAAQASMQADLENRRQENVLEGPEAEFDYKFGHNADNRWGVGISQSFEWPGLYQARRKAAKINQGAMDLLYREKLAEVYVDVKNTLIQAVSAQRTAARLERAAANTRRLLDIYEKSLKRGETTLLEVNRLRLQCFNITEKEQSARNTAKTLQIKLSAYAPGVEIPASLPSYEIEPVSMEQVEALKTKPLQLVERMTDLAEAEASIARRALLPGFKIGFAHDFEDGHHFNGFSIGITLPAWSGKSARKAAKAALAATRAEEARQRADITSEAMGLVIETASMYNRIEAAAPLFDEKSYIELLDKALEKGKITLLEYLRECNDYLDAEQEYEQLRLEYALKASYLTRYANI